MGIKIKSVQHIAIATKESAPLLRTLNEIFEIESDHEEVVAPQKVKTDFLKIADVPFELLEPIADDSPISKFLEKRGNSFHHLALEVENIEEAISFLKSKKIQLINEKPSTAAHGMKAVFIHPKSFHGLLIELIQRA